MEYKRLILSKEWVRGTFLNRVIFFGVIFQEKNIFEKEQVFSSVPSSILKNVVILMFPLWFIPLAASNLSAVCSDAHLQSLPPASSLFFFFDPCLQTKKSLSLPIIVYTPCLQYPFAMSASILPLEISSRNLTINYWLFPPLLIYVSNVSMKRRPLSLPYNVNLSTSPRHFACHLYLKSMIHSLP